MTTKAMNGCCEDKMDEPRRKRLADLQREGKEIDMEYKIN